MDEKSNDPGNQNQAGKLLNSVAENDETAVDYLTPKQLAILREKMELEKLLEATKQLQQQADMVLTKNDETLAPAASKELSKPKISKSSKNEEQGKLDSFSCNEYPPITEVDRTPAVSTPAASEVSPKVGLPSTEDESVGGGSDSLEQISSSQKDLVARDYSALSLDFSGANRYFSLPGDIRLLEENAELLQKKIDLEVLLQRARLLLEHTTLQESSHRPNFDENKPKCSAENYADLSSLAQAIPDSYNDQQSADDRDKNVNAGSKKPNETHMERLFEKTDDLSSQAKLLLDSIRQNKTSIFSEDYERDVNDSKSNSALKDKPVTYTASAQNARVLHPLSGSDNTTANVDEICKESSARLSEKEDLEAYEKIDLQQLLKKADSLLEKANRQSWYAERLSSEEEIAMGQRYNERSNNDNASQTNKETDSLQPRTQLDQELSNTCDKTDKLSDEDDDDDDDDDPSYDAKLHLQQLLQRAHFVLERSKMPLRERLMQDDKVDEPDLTKEVTKPLESGSAVDVSELDSTNKNKTREKIARGPTHIVTSSSTHPSESPTAVQASGAAASEADFDSLTQEQQLEFLLRKTTALKEKADSLICELNVQETPLDTKSSEPQLQNEESHSSHSLDANQGTLEAEEQSVDDEASESKTIDANKHQSTKGDFTKLEAGLENFQLEYEEIEESQLQINENDKSQLEVEDEYYCSDDSMSDMVVYYEDNETLPEESEFTETPTVAAKTELQQLKKVTDLLGEKELFNQSFHTHQQPDDSTGEDKDTKSQTDPGSCRESANLVSQSQEPSPQKQEEGESNEDDIIFDEREELRLLLEKTKLLLDKTKLPFGLDELEIQSAENRNSQDIESVVNIRETMDDDQSVPKCVNLNDRPIQNLPNQENSNQHSNSIQVKANGQSLETDFHNLVETEGKSLSKLGVTTGSSSQAEETKDLHGTVLSLDEQPTQPTTLVSYEFNTQESLLSDMNSSKLVLSAQFTQLKKEINSIIQETNNRSEAQDNLEPSSLSEQSQRTDTSCSGHSISKGIEAVDLQPACKSEAGFSDTGTGIPATDSNGHDNKIEVDSGTGLKSFNSLTNLTKLLRLQKDMAKMQLQLSNLQDSMRATSSTLQELLDDAFSEM